MTEPTSNYSYQAAPDSTNINKPIVYASFWERFAAILIDWVILAGANLLIQQFIEAPTSNEIGTIAQEEGFGAAVATSYLSTAAIASFLLNWLYSALLMSGPWQATLGKRLLGIKVVSQNGGGRISFINATGRYFATIISTIILFIGYLIMIWDDKKQTLHDKLAGTLVVKDK